MNSGKTLKYVRIALAVATGGIMMTLFLDIRHNMPQWTQVLPDMQIVPLLAKGLVGGLLAMALVALLVGRVYCSVICPLGILQDVIERIKKWWKTACKKRKDLRMRYRKPLNAIRYGVLTAVAVPYVLGQGLPLLITDPYSNFGRIAVGLFRPVAVEINNLLASALNAVDNYSFYIVGQLNAGTPVTIFAAVVMATLIVMVWMRGRLWCNTVCPVGTALGLLSRFSIFRIRINASSCNSCGLCEAECKSSCIDSKTRTVDASRCVTCFNCLGICKKEAVSFAHVPRTAPKAIITPAAAMDAPGVCSPCSQTREKLTQEGLSRRDFLKSSLLGVTILPAMLYAQGRGLKARLSGADSRRGRCPMPPGAISREHFESRCTACQLCVTACPTQVLEPAMMENGLSGIMQPRMRFKVESFCNFECRECLDVCPTHALMPLALEEKKLTRVGTAHFVRHTCIVVSNDEDCGACAEHCPTGAVHMIPYEGTLTIPQVDAQYCIGCGGCESICPVQPNPAIFVEGLDVHEMADPPKKDEFEAGDTSDFGF